MASEDLIQGEDPITGQYREFGLEVRRILGWGEPSGGQVYTVRMAEGRTGVSYGTISTMARGHRPRPDTIIKFADKMPSANPAKLLGLAGFSASEVVRILEQAGHTDIQVSEPQRDTRELILENIDVLARSGELSGHDAEEIKQILERRRHEKTGE